MALEGSVKTPFGEVSKKTAAIGAAGVVGIGAIMWHRSQQQASADAATSAITSDQIDPATGYAYGSPEDQAALAGQGGEYGLPSDSSSFVGGQIVGYDSGGNPVFGPAPGVAPNTGPGTFVSNAAWAQYVEQYLVNNEDANATTVGNAIGKYISGQALTADQINVVTNAIAIGGPPPVAGPNGNPPGYITAQPAPGSTTGTKAKNPVTGIHATPRYTQIDVKWSATPNATSYLVSLWQGAKRIQESVVKGTSHTFHDTHRGTAYRVTVWAQPSGAGKTGSVNVHTK